MSILYLIRGILYWQILINLFLSDIFLFAIASTERVLEHYHIMLLTGAIFLGSLCYIAILSFVIAFVILAVI